jgi:hypothetical protein
MHQIRCQYQSTFDPTLTTVGEKTVIVERKDLPKVSHSYTAQYSLSIARKLLPHVFLCFQELAGKFGPVVQKRMDELT